MKIVATIRTYNEQDHIEKCCQAYQFCDEILIADGGSTDDTVFLAQRYPKVKVIHFDKKVECKNGIWRNPDGEHLQFLWDHAIEDGADWIISQDCDQRPNKYLKQDARTIMEMMSEDFLLVTQIYLWGDNRYFPQLSGGEGDWWQGLWAWRANINLKVIDKMPHFVFSLDGKTEVDISRLRREKRILPPYCFMHFGWDTEEAANKQVEYYRHSGLIKDMEHPLTMGGRLAELLEWMIE